MIKQPKSKLGDYRITYYKDANNVYFGVNTIEKNDSEQTYQISILNFSAYKEYYLKIVKNK